MSKMQSLVNILKSAKIDLTTSKNDKQVVRNKTKESLET
jgi:hypothetical protein